jgi:anti-sigma factor RsiW
MSEDRRNLNRPLAADPECEAALELVPAYCLGATDPAETAFVEAKARTCPEVAAELAEYRLMTDALLFSAPLVEPPTHLGAKLLAQIALPAKQETPTQPALRPTPRTLPAAVEKPPSIEPRPKKLLTLPRLSAAVAAAAVVLLIASNLLWSAQLNDLRR